MPEHRLVEHLCHLSARNVGTADQFWNLFQWRPSSPGIDPFRRGGKMEIAPEEEASFLQNWHQNLARGSGIGRALQHHKRPTGDDACQTPARSNNIAQVGLL